MMRPKKTGAARDTMRGGGRISEWFNSIRGKPGNTMLPQQLNAPPVSRHVQDVDQLLYMYLYRGFNNDPGQRGRYDMIAYEKDADGKLLFKEIQMNLPSDKRDSGKFTRFVDKFPPNIESIFSLAQSLSKPQSGPFDTYVNAKCNNNSKTDARSRYIDKGGSIATMYISDHERTHAPYTSTKITLNLVNDRTSFILNKIDKVYITADYWNGRSQEEINCVFHPDIEEIVRLAREPCQFPLTPEMRDGGGKEKRRKPAAAAAWVSVGRKVTLANGTTRTLYKNSSKPDQQLRIRKMVARNGSKVATYVVPPKASKYRR